MNSPFKEFSLDELEFQVNDRIFQKGQYLLANNQVISFEETDQGKFRADIHGTRLYQITFEILNQIVIDCQCNCPYEGPICKHLVAGMMYLHLDLHQQTNVPSKSQKVSNILSSASEAKLKEFIQGICDRNTELADLLIATFGRDEEKHTKAYYKSKILNLVESAAEDYSYNYYHSADLAFEKLVDDLVDHAALFRQSGNHHNAVSICLAILEATDVADELINDNTSMQIARDQSFDLLLDMGSELPEELRAHLFEYCIRMAKDQFRLWNADVYLMQLASTLCKNESEVETVSNSLYSLKENLDPIGVTILLHHLRANGKIQEVDQLLERYLYNSYVRNHEIERLFRLEEYALAKKLALEGLVEGNEKTDPIAWYRWLLKFAQIEENQKEIIKYARKLFLSGYSDDESHYQLMKENVLDCDWQEFFGELINDVKGESYHGISLLRLIYIKEEMWPDLHLLLAQRPTLENIAADKEYLKADFSPQLVSYLEKAIISLLEENVGRKYYIRAVRGIMMMQELGGTREVEGLVKNLRMKYSRRPALREELAVFG